METKLLYRYLDTEGALATIRSKSFRISRFSRLNDPFEIVPGFRDDKSANQQSVEDWRAFLLSYVDSKYGLVCFSETPHESVLWSHYGDHHKGIAFEVDYLMKPKTIGKVRYSKNRLHLDLRDIHHDTYSRERFLPKLKELFYRKSPGWRYEREWRGFFALNECEKIDGHYYRKIPEDFLTRIILGCRNKTSEEELREILDSSGFDYVKISRARLCNKTYKVIC